MNAIAISFVIVCSLLTKDWTSIFFRWNNIASFLSIQHVFLAEIDNSNSMLEHNQMSATSIGLIILCTVCVIAIVCFFLFRSKKQWNLPVTKVEKLALEECIALFREPSALERLNSDSDLIAVVIKEKVEEKYKVVACTFSKKDNTLKDPIKIYEANTLDTNLLNAFGDKDMIVLS